MPQATFFNPAAPHPPAPKPAAPKPAPAAPASAPGPNPFAGLAQLQGASQNAQAGLAQTQLGQTLGFSNQQADLARAQYKQQLDAAMSQGKITQAQYQQQLDAIGRGQNQALIQYANSRNNLWGQQAARGSTVTPGTRTGLKTLSQQLNDAMANYQQQKTQTFLGSLGLANQQNQAQQSYMNNLAQLALSQAQNQAGAQNTYQGALQSIYDPSNSIFSQLLGAVSAGQAANQVGP